MERFSLEFSQVIELTRGKTDAPMMSSYLSTRIDMIDFLHCSSAIRTYDTSKYFIERINFINIEYDESLYHSSSLEIINNIKYYDEQYNSAMIIVHNRVNKFCQSNNEYYVE